MKKLTLLMVAIACTLCTFAQIANKKVNWSFTSKKVGDHTYELRMTAIIEEGWHIYSQKQPQKAIITPTEFSFIYNPLITVGGAVKEEGDMRIKSYKNLDFYTNIYEETVTFVQRVSVKADVKTNIECKVTYQTCTDEKCLPPATDKFSIMLQ